MTDAGAVFPMLRAAIARITPGEVSDGPDYKAALAGYATELLPALLGGAWTHRPRAWAGDLVRRGMTYDLFDHHQVYRLAGARGPLTWASAAVIGMPYGGLQDDGRVAPGTDEEAAALRTLGVGTWLRRDLSAWYPGWTQLVVSAPGLVGQNPASFGFVAA